MANSSLTEDISPSSAELPKDCSPRVEVTELSSKAYLLHIPSELYAIQLLWVAAIVGVAPVSFITDIEEVLELMAQCANRCIRVEDEAAWLPFDSRSCRLSRRPSSSGSAIATISPHYH